MRFLLILLLFLAGCNTIGFAYTVTAPVVEDCASATDWTDYVGNFDVTGGVCFANGGASVGIHSSTVTGDFELYYKVTTVAGNGISTWYGVVDTGTLSGYILDVVKSAGTDTLDVVRLDGGSGTSILPVSKEISNGDIVMLRRVGNMFYLFWGTTTSSLSLQGSVSDATYATSSDNLVASIGDTTSRTDNIGFGAYVNSKTGLINVF